VNSNKRSKSNFPPQNSMVQANMNFNNNADAEEPVPIGDPIPFEDLQNNTFYYVKLRDDNRDGIRVYIDFIVKITHKENNLEEVEDDRETALNLREYAYKEVPHEENQNANIDWYFQQQDSSIDKRDINRGVFEFFSVEFANNENPFNEQGGGKRKKSRKSKKSKKSRACRLEAPSILRRKSKRKSKKY
jgi:hypothetical protein